MAPGLGIIWGVIAVIDHSMLVKRGIYVAGQRRLDHDAIAGAVSHLRGWLGTPSTFISHLRSPITVSIVFTFFFYFIIKRVLVLLILV